MTDDQKPRVFDYSPNYKRDKIAWNTQLILRIHPPQVITHLHEDYNFEIHTIVSTDRYIP